jgi:hypothetical protein
MKRLRKHRAQNGADDRGYQFTGDGTDMGQAP